MSTILKAISLLGLFTSFITPFTLIVGIVNAIKMDEGVSRKYIIMAIISAYLIIIPLIYAAINTLGL